MAKFEVEQKVEVWYSTVVEAENMDEAIKLADEQDNWEAGLERNWTEEFWVRNQDTDQVWIDNGQRIMIERN